MLLFLRYSEGMQSPGNRIDQRVEDMQEGIGGEN